MRPILLSKIFLIILLPLIIVLLALKLTIFDDRFYEQKFLEYGVKERINNTSSIHGEVIKFISGESNYLPKNFNEREKSHLSDVRKIIHHFTILLYSLMLLFVILLIVSIRITLKFNNSMGCFVGKIMFFGGTLTIVISLILLLVINSDFSSFFSLFHKSLFEEGTYLFDPSKEIIVNLYPQQLFLDIGIIASRNIFIVSLITALVGAFTLFREH